MSILASLFAKKKPQPRPLKKILCIDDDKDFLAIASRALADIGGYNVATCNKAEDAVRRIGETKPEMILLDVMMPGIDGPTLLKQLKSHHSTAAPRVVFLTAIARSEDAIYYRKLGASGVISKPIAPPQLCEKVASIWRVLQAGGKA